MYDAVPVALANGLDANDQDGDGSTVLHMACYKGHLPTVQLVLSAGANVSARDRYGGTPLQIALSMGRWRGWMRNVHVVS
jgi:ankyrin repeat protein